MTLDKCTLYFNERLDCMPLQSVQRDVINDVEQLVFWIKTGSDTETTFTSHHPV